MDLIICFSGSNERGLHLFDTKNNETVPKVDDTGTKEIEELPLVTKRTPDCRKKKYDEQASKGSKTRGAPSVEKGKGKYKQRGTEVIALVTSTTIVSD